MDQKKRTVIFVDERVFREFKSSRGLRRENRGIENDLEKHLAELTDDELLDIVRPGERPAGSLRASGVESAMSSDRRVRLSLQLRKDAFKRISALANGSLRSEAALRLFLDLAKVRGAKSMQEP